VLKMKSTTTREPENLPAAPSAAGLFKAARAHGPFWGSAGAEIRQSTGLWYSLGTNKVVPIRLRYTYPQTLATFHAVSRASCGKLC